MDLFRLTDGKGPKILAEEESSEEEAEDEDLSPEDRGMSGVVAGAGDDSKGAVWGRRIFAVCPHRRLKEAVITSVFQTGKRGCVWGTWITCAGAPPLWLDKGSLYLDWFNYS